MVLTSPAFENDGLIPEQYTCAGKSINPPLVIEGIPEKTASLVLVVESYGASEIGHVHWLVFNIPPVVQIAEDSIPGQQGTNDFFGKLNYSGPCPRGGVSRYFFKLYAADRMLAVGEGAGKKEVERAMRGHILARAKLVGSTKGLGVQ